VAVPVFGVADGPAKWGQPPKLLGTVPILLAKETVCIVAVIPAKAGIQGLRTVATKLDPGLRRGDEFYKRLG
jgi:hypothetical protein